MHKQPIASAISTADLLAGLALPSDEPKCTLSDLLKSTSEVATVLSLCWILHILV